MEQSLAKNSIITLNSPKGFAFSEPFAEELRMLEDMANDINRTLEERAKIRITEDDLGSEKGIGYRKLQNLLRARKWQEADQETVDRMCEAMGREQEGWLTWRDIQNFPCADLRTINRLWTKFSKGNFGFSVQKQIWQKCGSPRIMTPLVGKSS